MRRALPALLLTLLIAACGGENAREAVLDAANRTVNQEGLRAQLDGEIRVEGASGPLPVSATAVVAQGGERTRSTADLSALQGSETPGGAQEAVTIGEDVYLRSPALLSLRQKDVTEEWILFDAQAREQAGLGAGPAGLGSGDPTEVLASLGETAGDVEEVGQESVRGADTTRYRTTVDLTGVEGAEEEGLREKIPTEVWIGEDGLVHRLRQRVPFSNAGQTGEVDFTLEYFDFGVQERIEPPPEEDVVSAEEAFGEP
ncbi:MAG: hypothetical protein M3370_01635 [Actinomycetota bacterium]|nr:hypothetical protein [Actinomycetota bacterium]